MAARAVFVSLLAHALVIGGAIYISSRKDAGPAPMPASDMEVEAPLGSVYVQEAEPAPSPPAPAPTDQSAFPEDAKPPAEDSLAGVPGLPDGEAHPIGEIKPAYPVLSRKLGEAGEAVFLLSIDENGRVLEAALETSSGYPRLDEAAKATLLEARFQPAAAQGKAVATSKRFRIEFRLDSAR